jgi:hypothetical protein
MLIYHASKLIHYSFEDELKHGADFDQRIEEILQGKTFLQKGQTNKKMYSFLYP